MNTRAPQKPPSPTRTSRQRHLPQRRWYHRWHRAMGITAAAAIVYLALTGLPLMFGATLQLGRMPVTATWVLNWYGLQAPAQAMASAGLVHLGDMLFDASGKLASLPGFAGSVESRGMIVAAGTDRVLLLDPSTRTLVDTLTVSPTILRLGQYPDGLVLETTHSVMLSDREITGFEPATAAPPATRWAEVVPLGGTANDAARDAFRAELLTAERWLQDLHSGRFFGPVGIVVVDLAALALLALAGTGLILWWRRR